MGEPIVNLTDRAILNSPYYTESITKAWVSRMIDAGWAFWYGQNNVLFRHCDSPVTITPIPGKSPGEGFLEAPAYPISVQLK